MENEGKKKAFTIFGIFTVIATIVGFVADIWDLKVNFSQRNSSTDSTLTVEETTFPTLNTSQDIPLQNEPVSVLQPTVSIEEETIVSVVERQPFNMDDFEEFEKNSPLTATISLSEMKIASTSNKNPDGIFEIQKNVKSNQKNTYGMAFIPKKYQKGEQIYQGYDLTSGNKNYVTISGTVFLLDERETTSYQTMFEIYGDGVCLYACTVQRDCKPASFEQDISNVKELEIRLSAEYDSYCDVGLTNVFLNYYE